MYEGVAHSLAYDALIMGDSSLPVDILATISIPTLVIDGGASPQSVHDVSQAMAGTLPKALYRTLDGQTHSVEPEALGPVLMEFFNV